MSHVLLHVEMNMIWVMTLIPVKDFIKVTVLQVMIQQTRIITVQTTSNMKVYKWLNMCASFFPNLLV